MDQTFTLFCQSCGMPIDDPNLQGTNEDGGKNTEYCTYCYKDGQFTADLTMEQMIDFCVPLTSNNNPWPDAATARQAMEEHFPKLKRWRK